MKSSRLFLALVTLLAILSLTMPSHAQTTWIVDQAGGGDFTTIQDCIDQMDSDGTILVVPGTYVENIEFLDFYVILRSDMDGDPGTQDISPDTTIIDGGGAGTVVTVEGGGEFSSLNGLTIQNGSDEGIYCHGTSLTITNCNFTGNGRGIYGTASRFTITDCVFSGNSRAITLLLEPYFPEATMIMNCLFSGNGSVILSERSSVTLVDCDFVESDGTAVFYYPHPIIFNNCRLSGMTIKFLEYSAAYIRNCYLSLNEGILAGLSSVLINNCTISVNSGPWISLPVEGDATIMSSILWSDSTGNYPNFNVHHTSYFDVGFSDIQMENPGDVWPGTGNINADPLFVAGPDGCYYLSHLAAGQPADSPCVDSGSNHATNICYDVPSGTVCMSDLTTRIDHVHDSGMADMGYHHGSGLTVPCPPTVDTDLTCDPSAGILPFATQMTVMLANNNDSQIRRMAVHIDVTMANGAKFLNWRAGFTNIAGGGEYTSSWNQNIPDLSVLSGLNFFSLVAEDVTEAPYNQPPYPPAGDTAEASCLVIGI